MSIRVRFIILYIAIIIVPLAFLFWMTPIIGNLAIGNFTLVKLPVKFVQFSISMSFAPGVDEKELSDFVLTRKPLRNFDVLRNREFFDKLENKLNVGLLKTGFMVKENTRFIYISPFLKKPSLRALIGAQASGENDGKFSPLGKTGYRLAQYHFKFNSGAPGVFYLIYNDSLFRKAIRNLMVGFLIAIIFAFVLVNLSLTYIIGRTIVKPLKLLEKAAVQIREGDLDFNVPRTTRGEIGKLTEAFEAMRQKLHESLQKQMQYENNRKELISGISHDLRTPIAAVKGYIEGIRDGIANSPEKEARYIEIIHKKATEVEELIDKLFLYSKLDLKQLPFNFEKLRIVDFLRDYLEDLQFDLEAKGITIRFCSEADTVALALADRKELIRVINNITDNSVKFMRDMEDIDKIISVAVKETDREILVEIRDNGKGIAQHDLPYIFERFYQAQALESEKSKGSGLGLAIAKMIVEGHGGRIWAESRQGEGTAVFFTLRKAEGLPI